MRVLITHLFVFQIQQPQRSTIFSLHDALPISAKHRANLDIETLAFVTKINFEGKKATGVTYRRGKHYKTVTAEKDRKSTRLNSSHVAISYAVFCLKKKRKMKKQKKT